MSAVATRPLGVSAGEFLSPAEVKGLCNSPKANVQVRVLTEQGIPFRLVGRLVKVSRYHVREWLAGRPVTPSRGGVNLELVKR